jgi:hypothetical protein
MIQKILSILTVVLLIGWLWLAFRGLPRGTYDPDGELWVAVLVLLDAVVFLIGIILGVAAVKHRASWWIAIAILAVPIMHLLSCCTCNPLDMVLMIFPIGVLPLIVAFKWNAVQSPIRGLAQ